MMVRLQRSLARADLTRAQVAGAGAVFWRYLPQITRGLLHLITLQSGGLGLSPDIIDLHPDSLIPLPLSFCWFIEQWNIVGDSALTNGKMFPYLADFYVKDKIGK